MKAQLLGRFHHCVVFGCGLLTLSIGVAGCGSKGPPLATVKGKVTEGGKPLAGAHVFFTPAQGAPSAGKTDDNGKFELRFTDGRPGAVPGKHSVVIQIPGFEPPPPTGGQAPPKPAEPPKEFRREAEVKAGSPNELNFDIGAASAAR